MKDYIQIELLPLVEKLRARYPGVRIAKASIGHTLGGIKQQSIRYLAPLSELKRVGLLTDEMIERRKSKWRNAETSIGDGFHLCESEDSSLQPGWGDLYIWTEAEPRERERIDTTEARRILKRIFKRAEVKK